MVWRRLYGDLTALPPTTYRRPTEKMRKESIEECSDMIWDNVFLMEVGCFGLDIKDEFFTVRIVRGWNRLLGEIVDVPFLKVVKARLDGALNNLI